MDDTSILNNVWMSPTSSESRLRSDKISPYTLNYGLIQSNIHI